jgi:hypothetical protein
VEAKRLRHANGTEVQAELFEDVPIAAEGQLGTASPRIKDNNRSLCDAELSLGRKVSQSGLFFSDRPPLSGPVGMLIHSASYC